MGEKKATIIQVEVPKIQARYGSWLISHNIWLITLKKEIQFIS